MPRGCIKALRANSTQVPFRGGASCGPRAYSRGTRRLLYTARTPSAGVVIQNRCRPRCWPSPIFDGSGEPSPAVQLRRLAARTSAPSRVAESDALPRVCQKSRVELPGSTSSGGAGGFVALHARDAPAAREAPARRRARRRCHEAAAPSPDGGTSRRPSDPCWTSAPASPVGVPASDRSSADTFEAPLTSPRLRRAAPPSRDAPAARPATRARSRDAARQRGRAAPSSLRRRPLATPASDVCAGGPTMPFSRVASFGAVRRFLEIDSACQDEAARSRFPLLFW